MKKYLSIMSRKTKIKCAGIIILAFVSSLLASLWPVRLAELYTNISNGTINTLAKGALAVATFGLIYLSAECITILRRVMLDCVIATHESEVRENSVEKLLKMPASFYSGSLSGEKTAQLNQGVAGFSQLIKNHVQRRIRHCSYGGLHACTGFSECAVDYGWNHDAVPCSDNSHFSIPDSFAEWYS